MNMKRLLSAIGLLAIATPVTLSVVACGTEQHKEELTPESFKDIISKEIIEISVEKGTSVIMTWEKLKKQIIEIFKSYNIFIDEDKAKGNDLFTTFLLPTATDLEQVGKWESTEKSTKENKSEIIWKRPEADWIHAPAIYIINIIE